jgi:hypothetical protein
MIRNHVPSARWAAVCLSIVGISTVFISSMGGCSGAPESRDGRFAAPTFDEYTEPMTNAVIGSPSGIVVIGADGGVNGVTSSGGSVSSSSGATGGGGGTGGPIPDAGDPGDPFDASPEGEGGVGEGGVGGGFGSWHFDDCSPASDFLADSSGEGANAQHALHGACVPGISGLGVQIRTAKDVVQVPDEPQFTVGPRVAVAAWVHPNTVDGDQPVVIKRLGNQTSFSLGIHKGNIEMSVVLDTGTTVISKAPITAGQWTHVAGMFDGTFVYLFINGQQFGQIFAAGNLRNVFAPIRIGATTQSQFLDGIVDEVFVSTQSISKDTLAALACIHRPSTLAVNPATSGPVPFDTTVHYDVAVSDNDIGACQTTQYDFFTNSSDASISAIVESPPGSFQTAQPGTTATFGVDVTGSDDADPGVHLVPFQVFSFGNTFENLQGQLTYELAVPTGCFVNTKHELMITATSVVDDPVRAPNVGVLGGDGGISSFPDGGGVFTTDAGSIPPPPFFGAAAVTPSATAPSASAGVWSFGQLMRNIAKTPEDAPAMTEQLFDTWLTDQSVNGFTVAARPAMQSVLLDIWPRAANGQLDLDRAPLRLQAIVDRIDLRNLANGSAGEGRFVFGVNDVSGAPQQFTVILEYNLPATTPQDVVDWANLWHGLSAHPFPSEEYNAALETITRRFAGANAVPSAVNGSGLVTLRTNEIVLSPVGRWELREFALSPTTGFLQETTVKETPDLGFNGSQTFADFANQNAAAVIAEVPGATGVLPSLFEGKPFMAGSVFNDLIEWAAPGIVNGDARFHASLNTCNGCHGPETNTTFLMVTPRFPGQEAVLSPFLTGTSAFDQTTGQQRTLNDLARRKADLTALVCGSSPDAGGPPPTVDSGASPVDGGFASAPDASVAPPAFDGGSVTR